MHYYDQLAELLPKKHGINCLSATEKRRADNLYAGACRVLT